MSVAGIDFNSFQADVVILDEDTDAAEHHVFTFGRTIGGTGDAFDRARTIRHTMPTTSWWEEHGVIAIGIEDPRGAARNVDSILYRVQGAILACLPARLMVAPWKPGEWRKELGLPNTGKEAPAAFARTNWDHMRDGDYSQDALDAYCLAFATRQRIVIEAATGKGDT
jgi:hypothetical protein